MVGKDGVDGVVEYEKQIMHFGMGTLGGALRLLIGVVCMAPKSNWYRDELALEFVVVLIKSYVGIGILAGGMNGEDFLDEDSWI